MSIFLKSKLKTIEKKQVFNIFYKNFNIEKINYKNFKANILKDESRKYILYKLDKKIVGVLCINLRIMNYFGVNLKVIGMSYMAIDKDYQKKSVSIFLKNKLFSISQKSDIIIGFARKAMDNYWHPYGFLGFQSFNKITLKTADIKIYSRREYKIFKISNSHYDRLNKIIKLNLKDSYGPFIRSRKLWEYYKFTSKYKKLSFYEVTDNTKSLGYFVIAKNVIYEIYSTRLDDLAFLKSIKEFILKKNFDEVVFNIDLNNNLFNTIQNLNYFQFSKRAWNGGHILKIVSIKKLLINIKKITESRLITNNLKDFSFFFLNINIIFKKNNLKYIFNNNFIEDENTKKQFTKLIFGMHNYSHPYVNAMFPKQNSNISYLDEF